MAVSELKEVTPLKRHSISHQRGDSGKGKVDF